ncbi:MAG: lipid II:glycine glycyltransferase FemX [Candidatus Roizmanbacteria bacterium]
MIGTQIFLGTGKEWNEVVNHPMQSWEWGEARLKMGTKVVRLGEYEDGKLINGYQYSLHRIPYLPYTLAYLPRSVMPSHAVLAELRDLLKKTNTISMLIEPYVQKSYTIKKGSLLKPSPHPLFPRWTQIIDLTPSEEELKARLKSKTRYNIGLAVKKGVEIKEMTDDQGFEIFLTLYFDTTKRQKYKGHTKNYHKIIFDHMKNGLAHILITFYQGKPLSAYELFHFKDRLYYPYGGSSVEHREVMASNLLMWEALRLGKRLGVSSFDLWGSLPPDYAQTPQTDSAWAGFTRFKEGYNANFIEYIGSYDLIIEPTLYRLYNLANTMRKKLLFSF